MKFSFIIVLGIFLQTFSVKASNWQHNCLSDGSGTHIAIDFVSNLAPDGSGNANQLVANPIWINISGGILQQDTFVYVIVINHSFDRRLGAELSLAIHNAATTSGTVQRLQLQRDPTQQIASFTGQLPEGIVVSNLSSEYPGADFYQTIEVQLVHDHWGGELFDPARKSSQFQFNMSQAASQPCL